jgi:molybdopterin molybdotransferase
MDLKTARDLAYSQVVPKGTEWVTLDQALGRVLAEPLTACRDLPAESRSRMDGYALRSSDLSEMVADGSTLRLAGGCAAAGHANEQPLASGECLRILTGAPLPVSADAVVAQEDVDVRANMVVVKRAVTAGQWVVRPGADVRVGERVLEMGTILTPTALALAAALGYAGLKVHRQPLVALLATGDELMELGEARSGPHAYCNNRYLLGWMVRLQGGIPVHLGVARDDPEVIASRLAAADADLVLTTGGIGHGDRDFVLQVWKNLSVATLFREIKLSPGRHSALGRSGHRFFCALPGNPWAAQVVFTEIVAPMLRRWQGFVRREPLALSGRLASPVQNRSGLYRSVRGLVENREGIWTFLPERSKGLSVFAQLQASPAYALIPPEVEEMGQGDVVQLRLLAMSLVATDFAES